MLEFSWVTVRLYGLLSAMNTCLFPIVTSDVSVRSVSS